MSAAPILLAELSATTFCHLAAMASVLQMQCCPGTARLMNRCKHLFHVPRAAIIICRCPDRDEPVGLNYSANIQTP